MRIRSSLAAALVAVAAVSLATAGLADRATETRTPSVDAELARHRARHRPLVPRPRPEKTPVPEPTETPGRQSGSSEGTGTHIEGSVTEHHRISGSGMVSVSSGAVDEGDGGNGANVSRVGPPVRQRPRRR